MAEISTFDLPRLYSQKAIAIATILGGPLAAGVLVRRNFLNLGKAEHGNHALIVGVVSTIALFVGLFSIPEHVIDKIPNTAIPAVYTPIIYAIVVWLQGQDLKKHKESDGKFHSSWKAAGIGFICLVGILLCSIPYIFFGPDDYDTAKYDSGFSDFQKNEEKALELFTILEANDITRATTFIKDVGVPNWKQNLVILDELDRIEGLYDSIKKQHNVFREYCKLRIESYELIGKAIAENTDVYDPRIDEIHTKIDAMFEGL